MADVSVISVLIKAKDEASRVMQDVQTKMGGMSAGFEKHRKSIGLGMTVVGGAMTAISVSSLKAASDVEEMQAKFTTVFGSLSKDVADWAKTHASETNRSRFDLMGYAATLQDTFVPMGFARDKAAEFSKSITALSVDLGSFNNLPTGDVVRDMQSALVGNTETVRKYGVVLTAATVEQEILNQGWASSKGEITEAMKVQARMNLILQGTTDAQGDAVRTSGSFANQMRGLQAATQEAQVSLGQALLPVITVLVSAITPVIQSMAKWMEENQTLAKILILTAAAIGGVMLVLGPMLLILPQLFAGMKLFAAGIRLVTAATAANPVGIILVALTTLATVVLPLVIKNWDKIWDGIKKTTETVANFIIGILNKLTEGWRKLFANIADIVGKLLDMGSKLPFVGDKFKGAADAIRGFSDQLEDGIPKIDITADKQEDLQQVVDNTAATWSDADSDIATANEGIVASTSEMASGTKIALDNTSAAVESHVKDRISSADLLAEIQASQYKAEMRLRAEAIQAEKDDWAERMSLNEQIADSFASTTDSLLFEFSEQGKAWNELGGDAKSVIEALAATTDRTASQITQDFAGMVRSGETWQDMLLRLDTQGSLNLASLVEAMKELGEAAGDTGNKLGSAMNPHINQNVRATAMAAYAGADVLPIGSSFDSSGWNKFSAEQQANARLDWSGMSDQQLRSIQQSSSQEAVKWAASQERFKRNTAQSSFRPGNVFTSNHPDFAKFEAAKLAQGGIVSSPTLAMIGEAGPEAVVPLGRGGAMGQTNNFHFHGAVYGVEDLKEAVVEAVRDHAISGGFSGVFAEA